MVFEKMVPQYQFGETIGNIVVVNDMIYKIIDTPPEDLLKGTQLQQL